MLALAGFSQNRYDVVIDEIMADPLPPTGLPSYEWIEIKNVSTASINLQGWKIGDETGLSGPLPNLVLVPDSFLIVCSNAALPALSAYGRAVAVSSFPTLDNDEETVFIQSAGGRIIHALHYTAGWYHNDLKKEGGWSL